MTGRWKSTAKTLILCIVASAMGMFTFGWFSYKGNAAEKASMFFGFVMSGCVLGVMGIAVVYVLWLRQRRKLILRRKPLTDAEFIAQLPPGTTVDPFVVGHLRALAARRFASIGGNRFFPGDRLEGDLHLSDAAPWAAEDFCNDLVEFVAGEEVLNGDSDIRVTLVAETFGELVVAANRAYHERRCSPGTPGSENTDESFEESP